MGARFLRLCKGPFDKTAQMAYDQKKQYMILTTTNNIEGKVISKYLGIVTGITYTPIYGGKGMTFKDMFSTAKYYESHEKGLEEAKEKAFQKLKSNGEKLKANAIVGISVDVESIANSTASMISVTGTAVVII